MEKDNENTKQLTDEMKKLRQRTAELKKVKNEHRKMEKAFKESEKLLSMIVPNIPIVLFMLDRQGIFTLSEGKGLKALGLRPGEVVGQSVFDIYKDVPQIINDVRRTLTGEDFTSEVKVGELIFETKYSPIRDEKGEVIGVIGVANDITESKQAVQELKDSEERLRILFDYAPDACYLSDLKGTFIDGNKEAERVTGYKREELIGKSFLKLNLLSPKQIPRAANLLRKNLLGLPTGPDEFILKRKDGSQIPVEIMTYPIKIKGKIVVLGIARDITERKLAQEKINASLREKEVLLQEVHHRVKNNLQIVSSLLRLQASSIEDEKIRELFKTSQERIKSIALIHEMLYGSQDLARIDFPDYVNKLAKNLLVMYYRQARKINLKVDMKNISLDINKAIPCGLIINELVSNALKHAFPEGRSGSIEVKMRKDKKGRYKLLIKDTGIGIPENVNLKKPERLGLQILTDLTKQLEGTVNLRREAGTEFIIKF